jgi:exopolysaccharide biosynthesis polyprenyl glycosylphosphotransferase
MLNLSHKNMNNHFKKILLLAGDVTAMYIALFLTIALRYWQWPEAEIWQAHLLPFTIIFAGWLVIFFIADLYNLHQATNGAKFFSKIGQTFLFSALISVLFFYFSPLTGITPKINLAIFVGVFFIIFSIWRMAFNAILSSYLPKNNIAIIGLSALAEKLLMEIKQQPHLGFHISFILDEKRPNQKEINGTPIFSAFKDLPELINRKKISHIILAENPDSEKRRSLLFECLHLKISFINLINFYETITGKVPIEAIGKMWFLENLNEGGQNNADIFKKVVDIIGALIVLLITIIFWPLIILVIKIESRGPAFFKQTRVGQNGQEFKILKFRTMRTENNDSSPTVDGDKRITALGNFLRKSRLDELPQILNILKGEMSFVGPRPERPGLVTELEKQIPFYSERTLTKPGLTGVDQISGEYHSPSYEDTMKKLQYDLYYIKHRSLFLDFSIILKTIATVFLRAGR